MNPSRRVRPIAAGLATMTAVCLPFAAHSQPAGAEAHWAAMTKCAALADNTARLACVDDVFRKAGVMATVAAPAAAKPEADTARAAAPAKPAAPTNTSAPVAAAAPAKAPAPTVAASETSTAAPVRPKTADAQSADKKEAEHRKGFGLQLPKFPRHAKGEHKSDQLEVTLAKVAKTGNGKLVLTTTDGAVWHQVEDIPVHLVPSAGQSMTIARTAMGGFMCKPSRWVSFRCYRTR